MALDDLMGSLHSEESQLTFLNSVYTPGNVEVADRIIALNPHSEVLDEEVHYALAHGDEQRFEKLAKKRVDSYVENDWVTLIGDYVMKFGNMKVANYAIAALEKMAKEGSIEEASDIAQHFGQSEKRDELLERLLSIQMQEKDWVFGPSQTYVKLGQFNEAIDLLVNSGYNWFGRALEIAKEHVPERIEEVAQRVFHEYSPDSARQEPFVEAARILDKTDEAKKILSREAKKFKPEYHPQFYDGLVSSLVALGADKEAQLVVKKVADHQNKRARKEEKGHVFFHDEQKELATLYETIGDLDSAKDILLARIDAGIEGQWHPSHYEKDIEKGWEMTRDSAFLERKLLFLERGGRYEEAAKTATELGDAELAQNYMAMRYMVSDIPKEK